MGSLTVSGSVDRGRHRGRRGAGARAVALMLALVVVAGLGGGAWAARRGELDLGELIGDVRRVPAPARAAVAAAPADAPPPGRPAATPTAPVLNYPDRGTGTWRTATAQGAVAGRGGELLRYRVAVEGGIDEVDVELLGREVAVVLADRRGWTGGGRWRLQRVGPGVPADFTVLLTTPATRADLCGDVADRYTSCRNSDRVVVNVARWARGVPGFGGDLATYRAYVLNHEVGHRLGMGHELCPARGAPAPVMQQQTLGLHDCVPNAWPYVDGTLHTGRPGEYDDPVPTGD
ncbi:Protein of unknown function [Micromonospora purpureochromogenes]|uniref:DUF3152 domain-containing protein n=1 Tax=Micromonospora purpureochromogenes TaxID=47872 RepID=A0A1C5AHY7_9ACTN|nr:DUF3152 domain-containing protein [Micromonospora purpureochromogenes]SCF44830.1 Protein of unknown function [Micromonospora purpureochromogenes]